MNSSRENRRYQQWNLVSTGEILCRRFLDSSIVIIRPNEMKDDTFSRLDRLINLLVFFSIYYFIRFSNFVPKTTEYGDPISYDTTNLIGLHHLRALDEQITKQSTLVIILFLLILFLLDSTSFCRSSSDITLIGFSKGCIVLNQLLHELTALRMMKTESDLSTFVSRIRRFIWLDGGHNKGDQTMIWPTDENLVSTFSHFQIQVEIDVTPFQVNSINPYKKYHTEQYKKFSELLTCLSTNGNKTINKMFFADEKPSIDKHFELLTVF